MLGQHSTPPPEVAGLSSEKWMVESSFLGGDSQRKGFTNGTPPPVGGLSTKEEPLGLG